jgi:hypothetical protein
VGGIEIPLTTPQTVAAGSFVWAAFVANLSVTQPTLFRGGGAEWAFSSVGLPVSAYRFAINGTTQTSLPGSITPASNASSGGINLWAGVS